MNRIATSREPKILWVLNSNGLGGTERQVVELASNGLEQVDVVTCYTHKYPHETHWLKLKANRYKHLINVRLNLLTFPKLIYQLTKLIRSNNYEIIQTHLKGADLLIGIIKFLRLIPPRTTLVCSYRSTYDYYYESPQIFNKLAGYLHKYLVKKHFNKILLQTNQDIKRFRNELGKEIEVIPNGFTLSSKIFVKKPTYDTLNLCLLGNIKAIKGYADLKIFSQMLSESKLCFRINIAGEPYDKALTQLIQSIKTDNSQINFQGRTSNISDFFEDQDIFLSFSKAEGLPNSLVEAVLSGIYPMISNIPAHRNIIPEHLHSAFIFESLTDLIRKISKFPSSKELNDNMFELQSLLIRELGVSNIVNKYVNFYDKCRQVDADSN